MRTLIVDCSTFTLGASVVVSQDGNPVATARLTVDSDTIVSFAKEHKVEQIYLVGYSSFNEKLKMDVSFKSNIPTNFIKAGR